MANGGVAHTGRAGKKPGGSLHVVANPETWADLLAVRHAAELRLGRMLSVSEVMRLVLGFAVSVTPLLLTYIEAGGSPVQADAVQADAVQADAVQADAVQADAARSKKRKR